MSRRFFVETPITGQAAVLTGQEAQHLSKVMRAQIGDEVILFDGGGAEYTSRVEKLGRSQVELAIIARRDIDRELPFRLVIGVALPKGDRQRWLVEKLVELGVAELVPLVTTRSVAQPSGNAMDRLQRAVVEASKQCGRNRLMVVGEARKLETFFDKASESALQLIAHPPAEGEAAAPSLSHAGEVVVAIGPEGGFTDEELALAEQHRWNKVSLGSRVLRTETAAVAIAAAIAWQDRSHN